MNPDEPISYMVQQLSNVAFTRYFAGDRKAELKGCLERVMRCYFSGLQRRATTDSSAMEGLQRVFALDFLLPEFERVVVRPAFGLDPFARKAEAGILSSPRRRARPRPATLRVASSGPSPSATEFRRGWERRLQAAVLESFMRECDAMADPVVGRGSPFGRFRDEFLTRWRRLESRWCGVRGAAPEVRWTDAIQGLRNRADELTGSRLRDEESRDPIGAARQALSSRGIPLSIAARRVLKWHCDREAFLNAFWSQGHTRQTVGELEPAELYQAWVELRMNEVLRGRPCLEGSGSWAVYGRLRDDPVGLFHDWAGEPCSIAAVPSSLFSADCRLMLVHQQEREIRRVWVQGEWDAPQTESERKGRLASLLVQAANQHCDEVMVVTPAAGNRKELVPREHQEETIGGKRVAVRLVRLVPDPTEGSRNQETLERFFSITRPGAGAESP